MAAIQDRLSQTLADRYRVERPLGRGGMATVFLAEDLRHHRQVAIKVLDPEVAAALGPERFLREIETVAKLTHPHILPLHDSGVADGLLFYVMPYVEGESLRERLNREKQLPIEDALRIAREVADALSCAHSRGIVHRDIKPENILLEEGHAVVADFGIARAVAVGADKLTGTGIAVGTPAYMSPEQAAGSRDVDGRSDLYSLGCVLYEMLAGQPPFTGPTAESLAHQHLNVSPRPVTELRPAVPAPVAAALQRALAKTPADRFNPVALFGEALGSTATAQAPTPVSRAHRARWVAAGVVAAVAILAVAAFVALRSGWLEAHGGRGRPVSAGARSWILVADFDGPPEDPSLARTAREIVCAALDQSPVIGSLPREQIQLLLEQAGKPDSARLTPQLAREIAYRGTTRTVLEGEVARAGKHFSLTLRVDDVEQEKGLLTLTEVASSEDALIPVLTSMARRVRQRLGESPAALRTTRSGEWPVATTSFEAYRRWAEGMRLYYEADFQGALRLWRESVALDPGFGVAWASTAFPYLFLGKPDSAVAACAEALRRPESLTPAYRLVVEGRAMMWRGDIRGALEVFERVQRLYPGSMEVRFAYNHMAIMEAAQGRIEQALAAEIMVSEGLIPNQLTRGNVAGFLIALGRFAEADSEIHQLHVPLWRRQYELRLALGERDWRRADSLARVYERDPAGGVSVLVEATKTRATVAAVRGEVEAAEAHLRRGEEIAHERGGQPVASRSGRGPALLAFATGRIASRPAAWHERDTTTSGLITRAYLAAASGDTTRARRLLANLRRRPTVRLGAHGATVELIEACIAARAGRWDDVVALLADPAREGSDRGGTSADRVGVAPERWLVAQAYERLGQPDSAAAFYVRLLAPECSRMLDSFARQRLVVLYARMGRLAEAKQQLAVFERDFTRPDTDLRHLVEEARAAVAGASATARAMRAGG